MIARDDGCDGSKPMLDRRLHDILESSSTAFSNGGSCRSDASEEFRVMLETILEPIVF
jgi:hypothetical protein